MTIEASDLPRRSVAAAPWPERVRRGLGLALTFLVGPAAAAFATLDLGMGPLEGAAVLILLSGWIGPRLLRD